MLTDDEAIAVVLGLRAADRAGLATDRGDGERAGQDPAGAPGAAARAARRGVGDAGPHRGAVTRASAPQAGPLLALADAARSRVTVRLAYRSWRGRRLRA